MTKKWIRQTLSGLLVATAAYVLCWDVWKNGKLLARNSYLENHARLEIEVKKVPSAAHWWALPFSSFLTKARAFDVSCFGVGQISPLRCAAGQPLGWLSCSTRFLSHRGDDLILALEFIFQLLNSLPPTLTSARTGSALKSRRSVFKEGFLPLVKQRGVDAVLFADCRDRLALQQV